MKNLIKSIKINPMLLKYITVIGLILLIVSLVNIYITSIDSKLMKHKTKEYQLLDVSGTTIEFETNIRNYDIGDTISLYKFYDGENSYSWMIDKENPKLYNSTYISHNILCQRTFGVIKSMK